MIVHTDLSAVVGQDTDGLNAVEPPVCGADVAGDGAGGGDIRLFEVDVVGDEEAAGSDGAGSRCLVEFGSADIGAAGGVTPGGVAEALELATADVFEQDAVGAGGCGSVEVDGDAVPAPDEETGLAGEEGAVRERRSADGDEGDDVGGTDAGVDAVLTGEVDQFGGLACSANGGFNDTLRSAGDGDYGAVMGCVERPVQQAHTFYLSGGDNLPDSGGVCAFGEVGDTLDDGFWVHRDQGSVRFYFHQL